MKKNYFGLKLFLIVVLLIVVVILIVQNLNTAPIQVLFWSFTAPVIAIILVSLLAGFFIGLLVFSFITGSGKQKTSNPKKDGEKPVMPENTGKQKNKK